MLAASIIFFSRGAGKKPLLLRVASGLSNRTRFFRSPIIGCSSIEYSMSANDMSTQIESLNSMFTAGAAKVLQSSPHVNELIRFAGDKIVFSITAE